MGSVVIVVVAGVGAAGGADVLLRIVMVAAVDMTRVAEVVRVTAWVTEARVACSHSSV